MTSARQGKAAGPPRPPAAPPPLERLPAPASSGKPPTPFSIADILSKPPARGAPAGPGAPSPRRLDKAAGPGAPTRASPLCALQELASKTFRGLELSALRAAEGRDALGAPGPRPAARKRRKSRTAFTAQQLGELETRFRCQRYLAPAERDLLAQQLGLSHAQVITWFQNRRAKLKRDLEEMKADVESLRKLPPAALQRLAGLAESPGAEEEIEVD
ncbi:transcription factor LBX2 [Carettochelys insculpta]|uniref:transcription factor LBX2 n=1 Tax=Carettochelys insculpta TaxID=44489 RepID=UPI003EBD8C2C